MSIDQISFHRPLEGLSPTAQKEPFTREQVILSALFLEGYERSLQARALAEEAREPSRLRELLAQSEGILAFLVEHPHLHTLKTFSS